jgi:hypothetical protein
MRCLIADRRQYNASVHLAPLSDLAEMLARTLTISFYLLYHTFSFCQVVRRSESCAKQPERLASHRLKILSKIFFWSSRAQLGLCNLSMAIESPRLDQRNADRPMNQRERVAAGLTRKQSLKPRTAKTIESYCD